jgi:hypothetical protein
MLLQKISVNLRSLQCLISPQVFFFLPCKRFRYVDWHLDAVKTGVQAFYSLKAPEFPFYHVNLRDIPCLSLLFPSLPMVLLPTVQFFLFMLNACQKYTSSRHCAIIS